MFHLRLPAVAIMLLLCLATTVSDASRATESEGGSWRQTRQGWQHYDDFLAPPFEYPRPAIHPAVVAALEVLLTITAMLALSEEAASRDAGITVRSTVRRTSPTR